MARKPKHLPPGITMFSNNTPGEIPRYRVRVMFKGRQHSAGVYETLGEAREARLHYRRQVMLGTFVPHREQHRIWNAERVEEKRQRVTVADYSRLWLADLASGPKPRTATTLVAYENTLKVHIIPAMGNKYLADVSQSIVDALLDLVGKESGPAAARNVARTLRAMFNHALNAKVGGMSAVPFKVTVAKSPEKTSEDIPMPSEVTAIAAKMPPGLRLAPLLAALCALRPAETLGLQRRDLVGLDGDTPRLNVARQWIQKQSPPGYGPPKYGSSRVVGIPRFLVPAVLNHLDDFVGADPEAPLFPSPINAGKPIGATTYRDAWTNAIEAAQVNPFVLHSLRHLGLTLLAVVGATNAEVMARGGHRDAGAAARYQHSLRGRDKELTAALGAEWEGQK